MIKTRMKQGSKRILALHKPFQAAKTSPMLRTAFFKARITGKFKNRITYQVKWDK